MGVVDDFTKPFRLDLSSLQMCSSDRFLSPSLFLSLILSLSLSLFPCTLGLVQRKKSSHSEMKYQVSKLSPPIFVLFLFLHRDLYFCLFLSLSLSLSFNLQRFDFSPSDGDRRREERFFLLFIAIESLASTRRKSERDLFLSVDCKNSSATERCRDRALLTRRRIVFSSSYRAV